MIFLIVPYFTLCVCEGICRVQKAPTELELEEIMSCQIGYRNQNQILCKGKYMALTTEVYIQLLARILKSKN